MLTDFPPAGFECGALNGKVELGFSVAIVGAGPIGLAVSLTAQFYAPFEIILIDIDDDRLAGSRLGATATVNSAHGDAAQQVMQLTGGRGVDTAIEAAGFLVTFQLRQDIGAPGGTIAHVGAHGTRRGLHAERSGTHKIMITPRLIDTPSCRYGSTPGSPRAWAPGSGSSSASRTTRCCRFSTSTQPDSPPRRKEALTPGDPVAE